MLRLPHMTDPLLLRALEAHRLQEDTTIFLGTVCRQAIIDYEESTQGRFAHVLKSLQQQDRQEDVAELFSDIIENHVLFQDMVDCMNATVSADVATSMSQRIVHFVVLKALKNL